MRYRPATLLPGRDVVFRTRLRGLTDEWSAPHESAERSYTHLAPGTYTFEVRARRGDGPWGPPARLFFELRPTFRQSTPFRVAAVGLLALLTAGAHRQRTRWIRARNRELEQLVGQRTSDLRTCSEALELRNGELAQANEQIRDLPGPTAGLGRGKGGSGARRDVPDDRGLPALHSRPRSARRPLLGGRAFPRVRRVPADPGDRPRRRPNGFDVAEAIRTEPSTALIPIVALTSLDLTAAERRRLAGQIGRMVPKAGTGSRSLIDAIEALDRPARSRS